MDSESCSEIAIWHVSVLSTFKKGGTTIHLGGTTYTHNVCIQTSGTLGGGFKDSSNVEYQLLKTILLSEWSVVG